MHAACMLASPPSGSRGGVPPCANHLCVYLQAGSGEAVLGASPSWDPACIRSFVGVSGCYDLQGLADHLHARGLYRSLLETIMSIDGKPAWEVLSPLAAGGRAAGCGAARYMPPCVLMHGTDDRSCPYESSIKMDAVLKAAKVSKRLLRAQTRNIQNCNMHDQRQATADFCDTGSCL